MMKSCCGDDCGGGCGSLVMVLDAMTSVLFNPIEDLTIIKFLGVSYIM
jgi:hypothetical protein